MMDTRDLVLIVVQEAGQDGRLEGHTVLQKVCYLVSRLTGERHGFMPYYYGPYSYRVKDAKDSLVALDFLREQEESLPICSDDSQFEPRRFTFEVTPDGKRVLESVQKEHEQEWQKVKEAIQKIRDAAGGLDYHVLSMAAKVDDVLSETQQRVTRQQICTRARDLGWDLRPQQVESAADLLCALELAERAAKR